MTTDERIAELETAVMVLYRLLSAQFLGSDHFFGFPSRLTETTPSTEFPYSFNSKDVTYTPTGADDND